MEAGGGRRELGQSSWASRSPAGGRAWSGRRLALTAGRAGVGRNVGHGERKETTQATLRRPARSQQQVAGRGRAHRSLIDSASPGARACALGPARCRTSAREPARPRLRPAAGWGSELFQKTVVLGVSAVRRDYVCSTAFPAAGNFERNPYQSPPLAWDGVWDLRMNSALAEGIRPPPQPQPQSSPLGE